MKHLRKPVGRPSNICIPLWPFYSRLYITAQMKTVPEWVLGKGMGRMQKTLTPTLGQLPENNSDPLSPECFLRYNIPGKEAHWKNAKILDFGCNTGNFLISAQDYIKLENYISEWLDKTTNKNKGVQNV